MESEKEMYLNSFNKNALRKLNLPAEAIECFERLWAAIDSDAVLSARLNALAKEYFNPAEKPFEGLIASLNEIALQYGLNNYTLQFAFIFAQCGDLFEAYKAKGIDEQIFWSGLDDFRCKLNECKACKGVWGTFVGHWFWGFFRLTRFALGRFQYEVITYDKANYTFANGVKLTEGDKVINFHIPSSGVSLTDEVRFESYKRAFDFYKDIFGGDYIICHCGSWLLYPQYLSFLPESSNLARFINDFVSVEAKVDDGFSNAWRLYGAAAELPPEKWPQDTSLRKAFAQYVLGGGKTGSSNSVFLFDGEKIIH